MVKSRPGRRQRGRQPLGRSLAEDEPLLMQRQHGIRVGFQTLDHVFERDGRLEKRKTARGQNPIIPGAFGPGLRSVPFPQRPDFEHRLARELERATVPCCGDLSFGDSTVQRRRRHPRELRGLRDGHRLITRTVIERANQLAPELLERMRGIHRFNNSREETRVPVSLPTMHCEISVRMRVMVESQKAIVGRCAKARGLRSRGCSKGAEPLETPLGLRGMGDRILVRGDPQGAHDAIFTVRRWWQDRRMAGPNDAESLRKHIEDNFQMASSVNSASEKREFITMASALLAKLANEEQAKQNEKQNRRSNLMTAANIVLTVVAVCAAIDGVCIAQRALSQPPPVCTCAPVPADQAPHLGPGN